MLRCVLGGCQTLRAEGFDTLVVAVHGTTAVVDERQSAALVHEYDHRGVDVACLGEGSVDAHRSLRRDLDDLAPGDIARHVEVVDRHVEEDASRHTDVRGRRRFGIPARDAKDVHVSDRTRGDGLVHRPVPGVEAAVEPDHEQDTGALDRVQRPVDLSEVVGNRLLAEDRLACVGRGLDQVDMGVGARADGDRVDVARRNQLHCVLGRGHP